MKRILFAVAVSIVGCSVLSIAQGQGPEHAAVVIPDSSVEHAGERGVFAHTNHMLRIRPQAGGGPSGLSPAQIRTAYSLTVGGANTIYIVDAFHYPTALNDFNKFSAQFGLPQETSSNPLSPTNKVFQVIYANGPQPRKNCGWAQESALDIQWAHAMAPDAKIVLVEAASNSFGNLLAAVDLASARADARQVSMSWGGSEFASEANYDTHFNGANTQIVYTAASGDTGGMTIYPGVSPFVLSAGGTRLSVDSSGNRISETGWSGSGGGKSAYELRPAFQNVISNIVGSSRGVPDWSFDADPSTGVSVYDSTPCQGISGWLVFGGTSVSAPALAGIINSAGQNLDTQQELALIYGSVSSGGVINLANFFDINSGSAGGFSATAGWDFVTGIGTTFGMGGK
jgi:subtilase family serine protease